MTFAEILEKYNLSQSQASRLLGIPLRTVQDWKLGNRTPPQWTINLIDFYISNHPD